MDRILTVFAEWHWFLQWLFAILILVGMKRLIVNVLHYLTVLIHGWPPKTQNHYHGSVYHQYEDGWSCEDDDDDDDDTDDDTDDVPSPTPFRVSSN